MSAPLHVLFLCARNRKRSPTAEALYRDDPRLRVRSAGFRSDARRRVSEKDIAWAQVIYVMERSHRAWLREQFGGAALPPIEVLEVPDEYEYMDEALQERLRLTLDPELAARLAARDAGETGSTDARG